MAEGVSFILVVGTLEKIVGDCFRSDPMTVLAHQCFGAMDMEEVLVKGGVTGMELCEDGRLVVVKAVNKLEIGIRWKGVVYMGSKSKM